MSPTYGQRFVGVCECMCVCVCVNEFALVFVCVYLTCAESYKYARILCLMGSINSLDSQPNEQR